MEVSYNLRFQKSSFSNRLLIDKEGEIVIYGKGFRLKGKGGQDKGELLNFSELKEFYARGERIFFITFNKEKYVLSDIGTQFEQLLSDLYRARNEFLIDALFMKSGKLKAEFDGVFERFSKFAKPINKGRTKIRLYERSMVLIPQNQDAFSINFNFVSSYEFDDMEYRLKIVTDDGNTIFISQLGNDFEFFEERMNEILGGMYENLVNNVFKPAFPEFHAATLLKLAYKMKDGKAVSLKDLAKIDKELVQTIDKFVHENEDFSAKMNFLRAKTTDENVFLGLAKDSTVKDSFIKWVMISLPQHNLVAFSILPRWRKPDSKLGQDNGESFFYKIIMEQGDPDSKANDKIKEIEQALLHLNFVKDPMFMDKKDLKHSPYQYAIRKMPFLRILRKSLAGRVNDLELEAWEKSASRIIDEATLV